MESLARQCQNHEKEIHRSAQQLQNAIAVATEEAAKSRAAKEVIKSLTAQVCFFPQMMVAASSETSSPELVEPLALRSISYNRCFE